METDKFKLCLPTILAMASTAMVVGIMAVYAFADIPDSRASHLSQIATMVTTQWVAVMGYFFGSSSGSAAKSKAIETMVADNANEEKK